MNVRRAASVRKAPNRRYSSVVRRSETGPSRQPLSELAGAGAAARASTTAAANARPIVAKEERIACLETTEAALGRPPLKNRSSPRSERETQSNLVLTAEPPRRLVRSVDLLAALREVVVNDVGVLVEEIEDIGVDLKVHPLRQV